MFDLFKRKQPPPNKVTRYRHKCECGNEIFRHATPLIIELETWTYKGEEHISRFPYIHGDDLHLECIKCGTIYNKYGEKKGE